MLFLKLGILIVLAGIALQDLKSRAVYAWWFPLLIILFLSARLLEADFSEILESVLINFAFLLIQFLLVSLYFSLKHKKWVNITASVLGWGDVFFLASLAIYLSVLNFVFFYMFSLVIVLILWIGWLAIARTKDKQIPLAGLQAILFAVFLIVSYGFPIVQITSDHWLLTYLE